MWCCWCGMKIATPWSPWYCDDCHSYVEDQYGEGARRRAEEE